MRITVLGAGAVGSYVGVSLAEAGHDVTLVARGDHLRAMLGLGLRVHDSRGERVVRMRCRGPEESLEPAEAVFLTAKAHDIAALVPQLDAALGDAGTLVAAQNGIPWWYFQRHGGALEGLSLDAVDPGGILAKAIDPARIVGCVIYCPTTILGPGIVEHIGPRRLELGHLDGQTTQALQAVGDALQRAGFEAPLPAAIRHAVWIKLLGNAAMNPISALVRRTSSEIAKHPDGRRIVTAIMEECIAVARATGLELDVSIEARLARIPGALGGHKTSMLQDLERGRRLELEPLVGAVVELGRRLGVPVPTLGDVYALAKIIEFPHVLTPQPA